MILTPTFSNVPIEKYNKTSNFSARVQFYSYFQNPCENSGTSITEMDLKIHPKIHVLSVLDKKFSLSTVM